MNRRVVLGSLAGLLVLSGVGSVCAQAQKDNPTHPQAQAAADDPMMQVWMKYATPSEGHKIFESLAGRWKHTIRWWTAPNTDPEISEGTNTNTLILGGRYLEQEAQGTAMGQSFEGRGISGFDNLTHEYQSVWIDNMGTGMMNSVGKYDAPTKTLTEQGTMDDCVTGDSKSPFRSVMKWADDKHYTYEMYTRAPDGKEFRSMEILYERAQ